MRKKQAVAGYLDWSWNREEEAGSREEEEKAASKQPAAWIGAGMGRKKQAVGKREEEAANKQQAARAGAAAQ